MTLKQQQDVQVYARESRIPESLHVVDHKQHNQYMYAWLCPFNIIIVSPTSSAQSSIIVDLIFGIAVRHVTEIFTDISVSKRVAM